MDDIFVLIFSRLPLCGIFNCRLVCKYFVEISKNKLLWECLYERDYGYLDLIDNDAYGSYKTYFKLKSMKTTYLHYDIYESINLQTEIYNGRYNIMYSIPTELCLLKNLRKIYIRDNCVACIPTEIGFLKKLEYILIAQNSLKIIPTEIGLLKNLVDLDLSYNYITFIPTEIGRLKKLKHLDLSSNRIIIIPTEIGRLKNLQYLSCSINEIINVPTEIAMLDDSAAIFFNHNYIWSIPKTLENKKIIVHGNYIGVNNFVNDVRGMFGGMFG